MIDKTRILHEALSRLAKLPQGHALQLLSYKRDRFVMIHKGPGGDFRVVEHGFERQEIHVEGSDMEKTLKTLIKREFPRSHKIRVATVKTEPA